MCDRQSNGYDLGFRRNASDYELVANFWLARINQQEFVRSVTQKYARKNPIATVQKEGFDIEEEETLAYATVRVLVSR
ncbi:MAG: DUF1257 domain-containing protein [Oscillatoria sp. SIO1A7]|nr:DUF1257 domain-containing protein [Oscillatoria sp. SIO1A7]